MMQLIEFFKSNQYNICFATPSSRGEFAYPLEKIGIEVAQIQVNNSEFDLFIKSLNPDVVVYDRFMIEEQFGWRIQDNCPNSITVLDTEDLHSLRKNRRSSLFGKPSSKNEELELRELTSIYRSDISLIISKYEMEFLKGKGIPEGQLLYLPFMEDVPNLADFKVFSERANFVTIGSFLHDPNVDGIRFLKEQVWPSVRKKLPNAEMHIYGSYPSSKVNQLTNLQEGFIIKGRAEDAGEVMNNAKVCLSPLRFGAGLKGKFVDAMKNGTPSVTTPIGAEGMPQGDFWPGYISNSPNELANKAVELYTEENIWKEKQLLGVKLVENYFSKSKFHQILKSRLFDLRSTLPQHRKNNTIGQILRFNTLKSTKYMSKWIEEKNKNQ